VIIHENTFERNSGTKGLIYITSSVSNATEIKGTIISTLNLTITEHPIIIGGNTFLNNSGYHCSNTLCIQIANNEMQDESLDDSRCGSNKN
jgi:hypothetical protein